MPGRFFKYQPSPLFLLVILLLGLLAVMGTLQYRWLSRVSLGERQLLMTSLRSKAESFCADFDAEITLAFSTFTIDADFFGDENRNAGYAARFDNWLKKSGHPDLVEDVFLAERVGEGRRFQLLRFNRAERKFEPAGWDSGLENLRRRLEEPPAPGNERGGLFIGGAESVVEDVPALVSSIASVRKTGDRTDVDWQNPLGFVIVRLDAEYIRERLLPALADRHFLSEGQHDYHLTVASRRRPGKLIYQSEPENKKAGASAVDVRARLLTVGFDKVQSYSAESVYSSGKDPKKEKSGFTLVIPKVKDGETPDESGGGRVRLVNDSAHWELRVSHRSGSLEAAITNARWWNLTTSLGILLLLGGSVVLIAVLSRRAQRLARRQLEFVAGVSHEFRTPLAVIHSLSENLAAGRIRDSRQVERYGAKIHQDARRLTEMVEQILEFAGAERGRRFYDKSPLDVGRLVENVLSANKSALDEAGWAVETEIGEDLPPAEGDEAALSRAIQNLLSNALKYSPDGRSLKVRVYEAAAKGEINITIEDEGMGIPAADLPHIFEPFYRGREVVEAQVRGSGLGLNLVKQIIESHGGRVSVESAPGRGSRFTLHLPAAARDQK